MRDGHLVGLLNWWLEGLQQAIDDQSLRPLSGVLASDEAGFYGDQTGNSYAASRYLLYYLQEHGLLRRYHHAFLGAHEGDPTGRKTLERVLGQDLERFEPRWRQWVLELRPFRKQVIFDDEGVVQASPREGRR